MGSLPNDSVFIGSRELKGKLAPVNTDENSFSGYLRPTAVAASWEMLRLMPTLVVSSSRRGSTKLQAACSMRQPGPV